MGDLAACLGPLSGPHATLLAGKPVPVLVVDSQAAPEGFWDNLLIGLCTATGCYCRCRCVSLDRLPVILAMGCDLEPVDSVFYVEIGTQKALEYGGDEKVMMCFDPCALDASWREVPADSDPAELAQLEERFPTKRASEDGRSLWFSRLPESDPSVATPYEATYGRWIPGDPFDALKMVVVIGRDMPGLAERVRAMLSACGDPKWE